MYLPYHQYLLAPAYSHECDRLPEPVWEPGSGCDHRSGDPGDDGEHGGGGGILQDDGPEAENLRTYTFTVQDRRILWRFCGNVFWF